jgi:hypothetical protein
MLKSILTIILFLSLIISCSDKSLEETISFDQQVIDMSDFYLYPEENEITAQLSKSENSQSKKNCYTMNNLKRLLDKDKNLAQKMFNIELNTRKLLSNSKPGKGNGGGNGGGGNGNGGGGSGPTPSPISGNISIPIIVHILYSEDAQNLSDSQILSQIQVLNEDFNGSNSDISSVPLEFSNVVANSEISFTLAQVIRKKTNVSSFGTNDAIKFNSEGGSDAISPEKFLNIWVGNIGNNILGYAQFPGGSSLTDGVVIGTNYFGTVGTVSTPFNKGRTTTHEIGHWLNLRHIWGDGRCKRDDFVSDTPNSDRPNYGCPSYPTDHCKSTDMTMNYMDYTDDGCMFMFTKGQKDRMRTLFAEGSARSSFYFE